MIPVIKAGDPDPGGPAFVVAGDGLFLRKSTAIYDCVVKVEGVAHLPCVGESLRWKGPDLPWPLVAEALEFFRAADASHGSEAVVLLELEGGKWRLAVPEQRAGPASVSYTRVDGVTPAGSIHSHRDMAAFVSGVDHKDSLGFDGLHVTLGRIWAKVPDIDTAVVVNGRIFKIEPVMAVDGMPGGGVKEHPWLGKLRRERMADDRMRFDRRHDDPSRELGWPEEWDLDTYHELMEDEGWERHLTRRL